MAEKDELGGTLPSLMARKPVSARIPGEELPFEPAGRFEPLGENGSDSELGRGGLGRVLLVRDGHLQREVAIKEILVEIQQRGSSQAHAMAERFLREARITASLEHPGVVPVYELGKRNDGSLYYAMKRVRGQTLADALGGCATLADRMSLMPHLVDVVQTLAYAHTRGVVHRDLKPENVMVGAFGETQVVDWGLARAKGMTDVPLTNTTLGDRPRNLEASKPEQSGSQTVAGEAMGTPRYMSPEQARGNVEQMDAQSDVWSLGVMLFEVLTGRTPFDGDTNALLLSAVLSAKIPRVQSLEPKAPAALVAIVDRALERDRARRFPSAVEMADALTLALGTHSDATRRPLGWLAATAALVIAALVGVGLWQSAVTAEETARLLAQRSHDELELALARSIAERAQAAWDEGDVLAASTLAGQALSHGKVPLARGVETLVRLSGVPRRAWSVTVPAGCSAIAARSGVVACATLGGVTLFDAEGKEIGTLSTGPAGWQRAVLFLEDGTLASGGDDKLLHLWNVEQRTRLADLKGADAEIRVLAQSSASDTFVYGGLRNGEVRRWHREGGESVLVTKHLGPVRALAVGSGGIDSIVVASSGSDGVRTFDALAPPDPAPRLDRPASALHWTEGGLVVGIERDLFLLSRGAPVKWSGHLDDITALASTRSWPLVSGSADDTVRAWIDGRAVARLSAFTTPVTALSGDPEAPAGPELYVATRGRTLEGWVWPRDGRAPPLPQLGMEPTAAAMAPDATVVVGFRDASLKRLVGARNAVDIRGVAHQAQVRAVAVAEHVALSGADDGRVLSWRDDGQARQLERLEGARVRSVAVSLDGERAAWSFDDGTLVVWSLKFDKEISRERDAIVNALAFSPDGTTLAAGREDKQIALFAASTGKLSRRLEGHDGAVHALAFSPDGRTLASGAADKRVTLWELASGRARAQLVAAPDRIGAVAFSPDGAWVAAGSDDGSVYVWDAASLGLESEVRLHAGDVLALGFGADRRLLVVGTDRTVRWLSITQP